MSFRYTDETWRPPFTDGMRAHFRVSYDPNSTVGASLYSGFVYRCQRCGAYGFASTGNVLYHRYSDVAVGWASVCCVDCASQLCRPLDLSKQSPFLECYSRAATETHGVRMVNEFCEALNANKEPP